MFGHSAFYKIGISNKSAVSAALVVINSPYLGWNSGDPEIAVAGMVFCAFEWLFVRLAPISRQLSAFVGPENSIRLFPETQSQALHHINTAGLEVLTADRKIIGIALEFGYNSPDSFTKAFARFQGLTPAVL